MSLKKLVSFHNSYITGYFSYFPEIESDGINFDPDIGNTEAKGNSPNNLYFAKYNSVGPFRWIHVVDEGRYDEILSFDMSTDATDNLYITGSLYGQADFLDKILYQVI